MHKRGCYLVPLSEQAKDLVVELNMKISSRNIVCEFALDGRSVKAAMKGADRSGAKFAVLSGEDELKSGQATVKDLDSGEQLAVAIDLLPDHLATALN